MTETDKEILQRWREGKTNVSLILDEPMTPHRLALAFTRLATEPENRDLIGEMSVTKRGDGSYNVSVRIKGRDQ